MGSRVPGFVTQVPSRSRSVAPGHQRQQRIRIAPQHVRVEQPAVLEAGGLGLTRQGERALDGVLGLEREAELHVSSTRKRNGSAVLLRTAEPEGWYRELRSDEVLVCVGSPVAEELPGVADFHDPVEIEVANDQLLVVGRPDLADELAARVDEVALAVEVVVTEGFDADPVDGPDVVAVGERVARPARPATGTRTGRATSRSG